VLDGVMHVGAGHVHGEPNFVVRQLLDLRRHPAIRPEGCRSGARSRLPAQCGFM
jgi:hypothetical protein